MSEENKNSFEAETKKTVNEFNESWNQTSNNGDNKKILVMYHHTVRSEIWNNFS